MRMVDESAGPLETILNTLEAISEALGAPPPPPPPPPPGPGDFEEAHDALNTARARWNSALAEAVEASAEHRAAATALARTDARIAVHLLHRDMVIDESGVTQLRGTFRQSRRILVIGALLTALGAALYAFGLPGGDSSGAVDVMRFTPGVPVPNDGDNVTIRILGLAGGQLSVCQGFLDGVLVGEVGQITEVVVGEPEREECRGRWLLPAGSWYESSGRP
jgi:hypothetical protein